MLIKSTQYSQVNFSAVPIPHGNVGGFSRLWKGSCCCLFILLLASSPGTVWAKDTQSKKKVPEQSQKSEQGSSQSAVKLPPLKKLLDYSQEMLRYGTPEEAARALYLIHFYYPSDPNAQSSLWQAANLLKEVATTSKDPDWNSVLDRFRRYLSYYPKGPKAMEAYFEQATTYHAMGLYREAQSYFKLFLERYPGSPLKFEAMRSYRDSILRGGRQGDADKIFFSWQKSTDPHTRAIGEVGEATLRWNNGDFQEAVTRYQKILTEFPSYHVSDPEILRYAGIANLRLGNTEQGRDQIYHYLTLVGMSVARGDVLLELAESYFAGKQYQVAQKLYRQIIEEVSGNERAVLFAKLRLAQYFDSTEMALEKWQHHNDLTDKEGDKPYLEVLEKMYRDPVAQDARFGLFLRYQERFDLGKAYEIGRNFLRNAEPALANQVQTKQVGKILDYLVKELLKAKRYVDIYDLYVGEYRHLKDFPSGPLQAMIGQAMESLGLDDLAVALYYRAMQWPLDEKAKTDLYFRRARLYLAMKDYDAMERLLKHLRKIYQGKPELADVDSYSAQLSAARGEIGQAQKFYDQALDKPTLSNRASVSEDAIELMVRDGRLEQAEEILVKGAAGSWLTPGVQQGWLLRIGNHWQEKNEWAKAQQVYERGLAKGMPDKGETVQALQVYLGDVLIAQDAADKGLAQYQAAAQGEGDLWKQMARERLTQQALDAEMAAMKNMALPASAPAQ